MSSRQIIHKQDKTRTCPWPLIKTQKKEQRHNTYNMVLSSSSKMQTMAAVSLKSTSSEASEEAVTPIEALERLPLARRPRGKAPTAARRVAEDWSPRQARPTRIRNRWILPDGLAAPPPGTFVVWEDGVPIRRPRPGWRRACAGASSLPPTGTRAPRNISLTTPSDGDGRPLPRVPRADLVVLPTRPERPVDPALEGVVGRPGPLLQTFADCRGVAAAAGVDVHDPATVAVHAAVPVFPVYPPAYPPAVASVEPRSRRRRTAALLSGACKRLRRFCRGSISDSTVQDQSSEGSMTTSEGSTMWRYAWSDGSDETATSIVG